MREKGQTEAAKTLETPVFSRGIEILTEKNQFRLTKANHSTEAQQANRSLTISRQETVAPPMKERASPETGDFVSRGASFFPIRPTFQKNRIDAEASPGLASSSHGTMVK